MREKRVYVLIIVWGIMLILGRVSGSAALGTAFSYQGRLTSSGSAVTATCDFAFKLYDAASAGSQIGATVTKTGITVTEGLYTTSIDFGSGVFDGQARWLEISVKCGADPSYTTLSPRQEVTPTPYALYTFRAEYANNVDDADADPNNELNTTLTLTGTTLALTDAGGTLSQDLTSLCDSSVHTRDDIYALILGTCGSDSARVPKTGQTTSYATGDDGDLEKGVAWPSPRFTDNSDGTVTDNVTGLIWLKNANCFGQQSWASALTSANTLNSGECGLSDNSQEGDWWLPNVRELQSLIDYGQYNPALPSGHPFTGVQSYYYWSSTTAGGPGYAWLVNLNGGSVFSADKSGSGYVWPVRGGP